MSQLPWRMGICERGLCAADTDGAGHLSWGGSRHPLGSPQLSPALQTWGPGKQPEQSEKPEAAAGGSGMQEENGGRREEARLHQTPAV